MFTRTLWTDEVGKENEVGFLSLCGKDVCSLECLRAVAKEVVDMNDCFGCSRVTSDILLFEEGTLMSALSGKMP